jgi:hypothetical protein
MRSLTGRLSFYLLSLLLSLKVSPSPLYLRLFFLFLYLNINIINSASISNIMATGQEFIRLGEGRAITSVKDTIRYLSIISEALRFIY